MRIGLVVGHAGDRLVEQQQLRLLHQQHADLEPLLLPVRQQPGGTIAPASASWISVERLGDAVALGASRART